METKQAFLLATALVLIAGAIFYLEAAKPKIPALPSAVPVSNAPSDNGVDFSVYPKAPELTGIAGYINAPPNLTIASLRRHVVLVDFWTYTCNNCIRTLPYMNSWNEKYSKDGLVIIGVHSPEFDFEKDYGNVLSAVNQYGIKYPVVLDSDHATWNAYQNQYWPRHYLIDGNGRVRFDHIGEGGYDETEAQIVQLLSEEKKTPIPMNTTQADAPSVDFGKITTPEIYFGYSFRRAFLGNYNPLLEGDELDVSIPMGQLAENTPYLEGKWKNFADSVVLTSLKGAIEIVFTAKNVNIVAGSENSTALALTLDGKTVNCVDFASGTCAVSGKRLYSLVNLPDYGVHRLRIDAQGAGLQLFTFTFG